jgi:protein-S-isoprenylcysteine O-methyltransferase Ste14
MTLFLVFAVILFVAAGTLDWIQGWVYLIYTLLLETATLVILATRAPETLAQRGTQHADVKGFDRVFAGSWVALALVTPLVAGLDKRFAWSSMPSAALYAGAVLLAVGEVLGTWAMVENEHFEQFVRIQADRAHRVVTTGPYRIVRHPGYAGAILGALATPLVLCTWWTLVPAGAVAVLFAVRTAPEDRTLRKELEGYEAYSQRTRYSLFPGVW